MERARIVLKVAALTILAAVAALACTRFAASEEVLVPEESRGAATPATTDASKDATSTDGGASSSDASSSGSSSGTSGAPTHPCAASADQVACFTCCDQHSPGATDTFNAAFDSCLCNSPGACKAACATTICAGKDPQAGDPCAQCADAQGYACGQKAEMACRADPACGLLLACEEQSGCYDKL